jgi:hypothetical protein
VVVVPGIVGGRIGWNNRAPKKEPAVNDSFDSDTLRLIDGAREVRIETSRDEDAPAHRTTIWVVTMDGSVFVRSVRGGKGRWYREVSANPAAALHVGNDPIPVRAVPVTDDATIAAVSEAYREKYGRTSPGSTRAMVQPDTLPTTLRLEPDREGTSPDGGP